MKILVTGANGYLGSGIVKQLLDDNIQVIAADFNTSNIDNRATIRKCNIFDISNPFSFFDEPDVLLHLAWKNGFIHNSESHLEDLYDHYSFIEKMAAAGIKKISIMGTMHEIGFFEGSIDDNTPCNPQSLYGIAKNALKNAVWLLCRNYNVVFQWLRGFYMVGNISYGNSIFSKIYDAEKRGEEKFPFNSGLNQYDFIDYDEFCLKTAAVVEQNEVNGIINICSGRPQKLSERVEKYIKENGFSIKLDYGKYPDRLYDSKAVWGNSEKIELIMKRRLEK